MRAKRITANLAVGNIEESKGFYLDYLGLGCEEFDMGWAARFTAPESGASVQLVTQNETAPGDAVISVHTDDVDGADDSATTLSSTDHRSVGRSQIARARTGWKSRQRCPTSRLSDGALGRRYPPQLDDAIGAENTFIGETAFLKHAWPRR